MENNIIDHYKIDNILTKKIGKIEVAPFYSI